MEEIQSDPENYRSSSSSPSRKMAENFFYLRKPASNVHSISLEDSPEWDEAEIDAQLEQRVEAITGPYIPNLASPPLQETEICGATVVWKDLTVIVKGKRKSSDQIVKNSSGFALPGTLTVIMGPAKSGKSTLLRAIAGKLSREARVYGEVYVNGSKERMPYGTFGYVEREDTLIESLTVREYLTYSALLQLPCSCKSTIIDDVIEAMSLANFSDSIIGGFYKKSLSPGERRRIGVARELVTRPHLLLIDEPLYNLDGVSALLMMVTLKKLAGKGLTLIFTMYQSSTEVFGLFDRICLLSNGNTLFFGETLACLQHFSNSGFPCPIMQSPSDHFLRAINTDFDRIISMCKNFQDDNGEFSSVNMDTTVAIRTLEATYKLSSESSAVESMIEKMIKKDGPLLIGKGKVSGIIRMTVLTWRCMLIMSRDLRYFWLRIFLSLLLALCIGTMFSSLGHSLSSVMARISSIFVFVSFTSLISIAGLPSYIKEFKAFSGEESNGHSGPLIFLLGQLLASIPFLFLLSISSGLAFYFLVGLRRGFGPIMYFVLNVFSCLLANEGLIMVVSYLWNEVFESTLTVVFIHATMMLAAGYFRMHGNLPRPIWRYPLSYAALHTYSIQGLLENEYIDAVFPLGEVRSITGMQALRGLYPISAARDGKWANLLVLILMAVTYRAVLLAMFLCRAMRRR